MSRLPTTTENGGPVVNLPPIHPGEILGEELTELGLSVDALARALDVPARGLIEILSAERAITADTALRLARYFGTSAKFWMNLQQSYDLAVAERDHGEAIGRDVRPRVA